jgi:tetratricopeptide (TPR) repeat protein
VSLARTAAAHSRVWAGLVSADEGERIAREARPVLEAVGDDTGLVDVWMTLAVVANMRARFDDRAHAGEQAFLHARRAGQRHPDSFGIAKALAFGSRPASEALAELDALLPELRHPGDAIARALLLAMLDRMEEARAVAIHAEERAHELGHTLEAVWLGEIALVAGDLPTAAADLKTACDALEDSGRTGNLAQVAARLGYVLGRLGRHEEAEALAERGRELADPDDVGSQVAWRQAQAVLRSARGEHADAERLAREAISWAKWSDSPVIQGETLADLAQILETAGRPDEAIAAWQEALDRYEQKEIIPLARRTRERLAAIQTTQA